METNSNNPTVELSAEAPSVLDGIFDDGQGTEIQSNEFFEGLQNQAPAACGVDNPLPPGRYTADITYVELTQHYIEGYDILRVQFQLVDGPYAGQSHQKIFHLKTRKISEYLEKEFARLGMVIQSRDDLVAKYPQLLHRRVKITVQYPNGSMAVYILGDADQAEKKKFNRESIWVKASAG